MKRMTVFLMTLAVLLVAIPESRAVQIAQSGTCAAGTVRFTVLEGKWPSHMYSRALYGSNYKRDFEDKITYPDGSHPADFTKLPPNTVVCVPLPPSITFDASLRNTTHTGSKIDQAGIAQITALKNALSRQLAENNALKSKFDLLERKLQRVQSNPATTSQSEREKAAEEHAMKQTHIADSVMLANAVLEADKRDLQKELQKKASTPISMSYWLVMMGLGLLSLGSLYGLGLFMRKLKFKRKELQMCQNQSRSVYARLEFAESVLGKIVELPVRNPQTGDIQHIYRPLKEFRGDVVVDTLVSGERPIKRENWERVMEDRVDLASKLLGLKEEEVEEESLLV